MSKTFKAFKAATSHFFKHRQISAYLEAVARRENKPFLKLPISPSPHPLLVSLPILRQGPPH